MLGKILKLLFTLFVFFLMLKPEILASMADFIPFIVLAIGAIVIIFDKEQK